MRIIEKWPGVVIIKMDFDQIKEVFANLLVLIPQIPDRPLKLYIIVEDETIFCSLAPSIDGGTEREVYYYLSRILNYAETSRFILRNYVYLYFMLVPKLNISYISETSALLLVIQISLGN